MKNQSIISNLRAAMLVLMLLVGVAVHADEIAGRVEASVDRTAGVVNLQLGSGGTAQDYNLVATYNLVITQVPNTNYDHAVYTPEYDNMATWMGCAADDLKHTNSWWYHVTGQTYLNNNNDNWFKANGEISNYNSGNARMFIQCDGRTGRDIWFGQHGAADRKASAGTTYAGEFYLVNGTAVVKFNFTFNIVENLATRYHDLGGMITTDGHTLRSGLLVRGAATNGENVLPEADLLALKNLGIKAELDLRTDAEALNITASPLGGDVNYKRISNLTHYVDGVRRFPANYKKDFLFIYNNLKQGKPVYYHCIWGVDRTGTLSILLEGLLGVSREDIYADYNRSANDGLGALRPQANIDNIFTFIETMEGATLKEKFFNYWRLYASVPYSNLVDFRNIMLGTSDDTTEPAWDIHLPSVTFGDYPISNVTFDNVKVNDRFWAPRITQNQQVTIPIALQQCFNTGRVDNFLKAAGKKGGYFSNNSCTFDDTDIYKIIEGVSYSIQTTPNAELEATMDELIQDIADAQEEDGYIYTARTAGNPEGYHIWVYPRRWEGDPDLSHELYNCGHLFEAAAAHYTSTGKTTLLNVATKAADLLVRDFLGRGLRYEPGHQIVEMGLVKLYRITHKEEYMALAKYFLDLRGNTESAPSLGKEYCQIHKPVTEQDEAVGHAVRAVYMYSGMADVAALMGDNSYFNAISNIWENVVSKKYYVMGGIGARHDRESFGNNYELPNASAYNETCAAIGNIYWNWRMFLMHGEAKYYDVIERTLYNGVLSGIGLDGKSFFYPNPLAANFDYGRSEWFGCACCPSNLCRFIPSVPGYIYAHKDKNVYVNLFMQNTANLTLDGGSATLTQTTDYPFDGKVSIKLSDLTVNDFNLMIRKPGWANNQPVPSDLYSYIGGEAADIKVYVNGNEQSYTMENGYMVIANANWQNGDVVSFELPMDIHRVQANGNVADDADRIALERGPVVFALESPDNHGDLSDLVVKADDEVTYQYDEDLLGGVMTLNIAGHSLQTKNGVTALADRSIKAIPYYAWANRGLSEMEVWMPTTESQAEAITRTVIDAVDAGNRNAADPNSEVGHNFQSNGGDLTGSWQNQTYRHVEGDSKWFSYDLSTAGIADEDLDHVSVLVRYWGADKQDTNPRYFSVMVDDVILRNQLLDANNAAAFIEYEYPVDRKLIEGKDKLTVKFRGIGMSVAGGVFYVKLVTGYDRADRKLTAYAFEATDFERNENITITSTDDNIISMTGTAQTDFNLNLRMKPALGGTKSIMPNQYLLVMRGTGFTDLADLWWILGTNHNTGVRPTMTKVKDGVKYLVWDLRRSRHIDGALKIWGNEEIPVASENKADYALFCFGLTPSQADAKATLSDVSFYSPHELAEKYGDVFTLSDICSFSGYRANDQFIHDGRIYKVNSANTKASRGNKLDAYSNVIINSVCGYPIDAPSITISKYGFSSFTSADAYTMPEGLRGATVTCDSNDGDEFPLHLDYSYSAGSYVPDGEALVINGNEGKYEVELVPSTAQKPVANNFMHGDYTANGTMWMTSYDMANADNYYYYKLTTKNSENFGFYWGSSDGSPFAMTSNERAYLVLPQTMAQQVRSFAFDDIETGICATKSSHDTAVVYDLSGRCFGKNSLKHGVYIVNGKKIVK